MEKFDHWTVEPEDYKLFFGCSREELLKDWGKEHLNVLKQKAYYRMLRKFPIVSDFAVRDMYCDEDVTQEMLSSFGYDFFQNLEKQLDEIKDSDPVLALLQQEYPDKNICVVDYGCGNGRYAIWAKMLGYERVEAADVPNRSLQFLRYLCNKNELNIIFREMDQELCVLDHPIDFLINNEVMEHVFAPEKVMKHLVHMMRIGGVAYISTFFNNIYLQDPSHLEHNEKYQDDKMWFRFLESLGLESFYKDPNGCTKGFRRVRQVD